MDQNSSFRGGMGGGFVGVEGVGGVVREKENHYTRWDSQRTHESPQHILTLYQQCVN